MQDLGHGGAKKQGDERRRFRVACFGLLECDEAAYNGFDACKYGTIEELLCEGEGGHF
jgi:hypothetical protein